MQRAIGDMSLLQKIDADAAPLVVDFCRCVRGHLVRLVSNWKSTSNIFKWRLVRERALFGSPTPCPCPYRRLCNARKKYETESLPTELAELVFEARGYWKLFSKGIISSKFWKSVASFSRHLFS